MIRLLINRLYILMTKISRFSGNCEREEIPAYIESNKEYILIKGE
jgi:hypothetical protein